MQKAIKLTMQRISECRGYRRHYIVAATFTLVLVLIAVPASAQILPPAKPAHTSKDFGHKQNHLAREASPYLRMHATNPVDWYPWGPEALQKALAENKPIFLSVGYSTCFWCHVMERQVFENPEIAAYLNQHFVSIKVDREERPDIDDVYMTALQVYFQLAQSSQGGGWPLSMFLTPDGRPIAGGTYFPPGEVPGQTSFPTVLQQVRKAWQTREADVRKTADLITQEVARLSAPATSAEGLELGPELVGAAVKAIAAAYDDQQGGFDFDPQAPEGAKFPAPCRLQLLQSQVGRPPSQGNVDPAAMLDHTLAQMAAGGIRDHLGGGFHRYSTDRRWHVPHFEKMLYDNAQLAEVYVDAYRRTGSDQYRQIAEGIFSFVQRELTAPNGAFYSALDAETDGVEGAYYVWSKSELEQVLSAGNLRIFAAAYGTEQPSAFEPGLVLRMTRPQADVAESLGMPVGELEIRLQQMRQQLLELRQKRPALLKDDQILTAWNGLMIRAYARAGQALKRQDYLEAAARAAVHLLAEHRDPNGGLLRTAAEPPDQQQAFLEDYAFLVSGLLALYDATHEDKWLNAARRLTDEQINLFWDQKHGGFFFTAHRQEIVLVRLKGGSDGEMPSGNSVSAQNLVRLARLKSDETYRNYAEKTLIAFGPQIQQHPRQSPYMAMALQEYLHWYGAPETQAAGNGLFSGGLSNPSRPRPLSPKEPGASLLAFSDRPETTVLLHTTGAPVPHVLARGFLSVDRLNPGQDCKIAVELVIEPGWHLNANPPRPDFVTPLTLSMTGPVGVELQDIQYPAGRELSMEGIEESLSVYEGNILVTGIFTVPADADGQIEIKIDLKLQVCDHQKCLPPTLLTLAGQIPVAPPGHPGRAVNATVFQVLPRAVPASLPSR